MKRWLYSINIKQHLSEGTDKAAIEKALAGIKEELRKLPAGLINRNGVRRFQHYADLAIREEDVNIFNMGLDCLYTWADEERIWMGI